MKTLLSIFVLVAITFGNGGNEEPETTATGNKVIEHETFSAPAEFGFGNNFYLDVDKDGTSDYLFTTIFESEEGNISTKYIVNAIGENKLLTVDNNAAIADNGHPLESFGNISWNNAPAYILEQVENGDKLVWEGLWSGDRDQYVGIKLVKDGKSYTGWVKVFIDQYNEKAQVEGYAINRVADASINAGEL